MSGKTPRVIGTTEKAIAKAEAETGFRFPPSFRAWVIENNGLEIDGIHKTYPVFDERSWQKTSYSITKHFQDTWAEWIEIFEEYGEPFDFSHLFPFAEAKNGDCYCFDFSRKQNDGETPIVIWFHDDGETEVRAESFAEFVEKAKNGDFKFD